MKARELMEIQAARDLDEVGRKVTDPLLIEASYSACLSGKEMLQ